MGDLCKLKRKSIFPLGKGILRKKLRIVEYFRLERTSGCHLVLPLCSKQVQLDKVAQTLSRWVLSISKDGDSTVPVVVVVPVSDHLCGELIFFS